MIKEINFENKFEIIVYDTKKENGKIIHYTDLSDIDFKKNVTAVVNSLNRNDSSSNLFQHIFYIKLLEMFWEIMLNRKVHQ